MIRTRKSLITIKSHSGDTCSKTFRPTNAIGEEEDTELILSAENDQPIQIPLILRTGTEVRELSDFQTTFLFQKVNEKQEDLVDEYNQPPASTLQLPLPFSSVTGNSHLEFQQNILDNLPPMSPPLITSTTLAPETDKVDAFMDLLKKSAGNQLDDQDLRPSGNGQEDMDQDLRLPPNGDTEELMDYDQLDTPMSPSAESMDTSEPPTTKPASSGGITMDALSTLATLAGKDTGSINLNLVGGLDLAGILSKVESAQQASTTPQIQQHVSYVYRQHRVSCFSTMLKKTRLCPSSLKSTENFSSIQTSTILPINITQKVLGHLVLQEFAQQQQILGAAIFRRQPT